MPDVSSTAVERPTQQVERAGRQAMERAVEWFVAQQAPEGYWWGELEANVTITAEQLLLTEFLGIGDRATWDKMTTYLLSRQRADGTWAVWYGGPGDLNCTVEAYVALKLAGLDPDDPRMANARRFILARGGAGNARVFTKFWLALFGEFDWDALPVMPPELVISPTWFPVNLYEFSSWARATIVPITVLRALRPVRPFPGGMTVAELFLRPEDQRKPAGKFQQPWHSWHNRFLAIDHLLRHSGRVLTWRPLRARSLKRAEQWILDRQDVDGGWAGIQPPWVYSLMALSSLGYAVDSEPMRRGLDAFKTFYVEDDDGLHLQSCISPLWDTCLGIIALVDCGVPAEDPAVRKAVDYLLDAQIWTGGDWQVKNKRGRPGGWPFEFVNNLYPDVDDSAVVMNSLLRATPPPGPLSPSTPLRADVNGEGEIKHRVDNAIARGMEWCLSMQSKNGGWGAFDVDNTKRFITQIPFADFGETIDPPSEDVTAHMVEVMGMLGYDRNSAELERGLAYLRATQEPDGAWWGRWGVNYIYGTGAVLQALEAAGEDMRQSYVQRALDWLESVQQPSGAWGEDTHSYVDPSTRGEGAATASQTAWALLGLIAGGRIDSEAVLKGVQWLERTQLQSGTWNEPEYTGTGFPRDFMINYHLYRHYFPMMALGRYVHRTSGGRRVED